MALDAATRRAVNERALRQFVASWDPAWRWVLVLGIRDLRANLERLGELASAERGGAGWSDDDYVCGPVALGLTATAVNEAALHCEDLFAMLMFLPERLDFVKRLTSYSAGKVTGFGRRLAEQVDETIRAHFFFPSATIVSKGLIDAPDPPAAEDLAAEAVSRLGDLTRSVAAWYLTYEFFHVQYKHGLKLPLRPFSSELPDETIEKRKRDVEAPLIAFTNEPLAKMLKRPPSQQTIVVPDPGEPARPHLAELIEDRALLRYQLAGADIDLDEIADLCWTIVRLLRIATANRLSAAAGPGADGEQTFELPGPEANQTISVALRPDPAITLDDFASSPPPS
jgi:hypothetical protein